MGSDGDDRDSFGFRVPAASGAPAASDGSADAPDDVRPPSRVQRGWWWALDYLYATERQLALLLVPGRAGRRAAPRAWAAGSDALPEIVLLPGVYEHWSFLRPLGDALSAAGYRVSVVHGLGANHRDIVETAHRLGRTLAGKPAPAAGRVLVAHSKGGLIGKHVLLHPGDAPLELRGLVAVCTPFHGSKLARIFFLPSIRAFLPDNATIVMLAADASMNRRIVSIFGRFDPHIPAGSALDGATNVAVPGAGHFRVLGDPATHRAVIEGVQLLSALD